MKKDGIKMFDGAYTGSRGLKGIFIAIIFVHISLFNFDFICMFGLCPVLPPLVAWIAPPPLFCVVYFLKLHPGHSRLFTPPLLPLVYGLVCFSSS